MHYSYGFDQAQNWWLQILHKVWDSVIYFSLPSLPSSVLEVLSSLRVRQIYRYKLEGGWLSPTPLSFLAVAFFPALICKVPSSYCSSKWNAFLPASLLMQNVWNPVTDLISNACLAVTHSEKCPLVSKSLPEPFTYLNMLHHHHPLPAFIFNCM